MLLDLASHGHQLGLYQDLHREAVEALGCNASWEDLGSFKKLRLTHSCTQESLRLNPIPLHASNREVIHADGLTLPTGQHLPRGTWVGASTIDVNLDERFYPNPMQYDPRRFLSEGQPTESRKIDRLTTTSTFLSFGAGRHSW